MLDVAKMKMRKQTNSKLLYRIWYNVLRKLQKKQNKLF